MLSFAEKVRDEAATQRTLKAEGKPIPKEQKYYTRLSGLIVFLVSGFGSLLVFLIGVLTDTFYIGFILLFAALAGIGLIQALVGTSFLLQPPRR